MSKSRLSFSKGDALDHGKQTYWLERWVQRECTRSAGDQYPGKGETNESLVAMGAYHYASRGWFSRHRNYIGLPAQLWEYAMTWLSGLDGLLGALCIHYHRRSAFRPGRAPHIAAARGTLAANSLDFLPRHCLAVYGRDVHHRDADWSSAQCGVLAGQLWKSTRLKAGRG